MHMKIYKNVSKTDIINIKIMIEYWGYLGREMGAIKDLTRRRGFILNEASFRNDSYLFRASIADTSAARRCVWSVTDIFTA